jgi:hypothetical protein
LQRRWWGCPRRAGYRRHPPPPQHLPQTRRHRRHHPRQPHQTRSQGRRWCRERHRWGPRRPRCPLHRPCLRWRSASARDENETKTGGGGGHDKTLTPKGKARWRPTWMACFLLSFLKHGQHRRNRTWGRGGYEQPGVRRQPQNHFGVFCFCAWLVWPQLKSQRSTSPRPLQARLL